MLVPLEGFVVAPDDARFLDRELSQIQFNARVLALAADADLPLLERVKYVAIYSDNVDEYVQKRLALLDQDPGREASSWLSPAQTLDEVRRMLGHLSAAQARIFHDDLVPALAKEGIELCAVEDLDDDEREFASTVFADRLFPVLTPLAIDPGRPFPHISTLSLNLAVLLDDPSGGGPALARVKIPALFDRFLQLPQRSDGSIRLVPTEQVVAAHLGELFPRVGIRNHGLFRITRHAHQAFAEEEAEDLLETIESGLLERRFGPVVRLEAEAGLDDRLLERFRGTMDVERADVHRIDGLLNLGGLWQLYALERPDLKAPRWTPRVPPPFRGSGQSRPDILASVRERDLLVQHPYDSFEHTVQAFIEQAAADPDVLAIKLTIYRTTPWESPIVEALIRAAEAGKQAVALVELKARFDEEANIRRARRLERAGVHVVYGLIGLKTHTKTCLVVRDEGGGRLRRYAHVGTGNYNPRTARMYEDLGILTADPRVGEDLSELFNMLTGYSRADPYEHLLVAPVGMRRQLLALIDRETDAGPDGRIVLKLNNLVDAEAIEHLYQASDAGVEVDLIVRSMCALRPGVAGMSERIRVRSILGEFLEHSRIFRFGTPDRGIDYLIGSADLMARNLDGRVEAIVPVTDDRARARLEEILTLALTDDTLAWELGADGRYRRVHGEAGINLHTALKERALARG